MLTSTLVLASFASSALAVNTARALQFPDTVSLAERQAEGGRYECHADCGYALQGSSEDGYCDDSEWLDLFNGCLECALEYDIWKHYGGGLGPAAEACGLDATPKPADGGDDDATTTTAETTAAETTAVETTAAEATESEPPVSETSAVEETTAADSTTVEETTVAEVTTTSEPVVTDISATTSTSTWTTTPATTVPGNATETGEPTPIPTGAASKNWGSVVVAGAGAAVILAINMI